jgi:hypothetical protein
MATIKRRSTIDSKKNIVNTNDFPECACGCGEKVKKKNNKYIFGHQNRGRKGQVAWNKGLTVDTLKWHKEDCQCFCCKAKRKEYVGENHPMYNKHHTEEALIKIRYKRSLQVSSGMKDKHHKEESKIQMSLSKGCDGILKEKISVPCECGCGQMTNPGSRFIFGHQRIDSTHSDESKLQMSSIAIENWANLSEEERNLKIKNTRPYSILPNKAEIKVLNILNENYPNEWKYTGDFSFIINGKSPDFTNVNGKKKLIELYGDYWHQGQNPQDRIDIFKPYGYDTLVIWEHELKDIEKVKQKIDNFAG